MRKGHKEGKGKGKKEQARGRREKEGRERDEERKEEWKGKEVPCVGTLWELCGRNTEVSLEVLPRVVLGRIMSSLGGP